MHFVTNVTYKRKDIFHNISSCRFMLMCLGYHRYMMDFNLFGYVIMPDHFHLLIQPTSDKNNLSKIMQHIKGNFARKYNELIDNNKKGRRHLSAVYKTGTNVSNYKPVWQEGFYDTAMRNEKQIFSWLEYMHWNPVKNGLVAHPKEYEFSSYHQYFGEKRTWIQLPIDLL